MHYNKTIEKEQQTDKIQEETIMMKLTKTQIATLNETAKTDFPKAKAMLDGMNMVLNTQYGWLAGRVVWFENPNGCVAEKYAAAHDAYVWAE